MVKTGLIRRIFLMKFLPYFDLHSLQTFTSSFFKKAPLNNRLAICLKKCLSLTGLVLSMISIISLSVGCNVSHVSASWQELYKDKEWVNQLNQFLGLAYYEEGDKAAFVGLTSNQMNPSLYSTYAVIRMMKTLNENIIDKNEIIEFIESLRHQNGAYLDPSITNHQPARESMYAISILSEFGSQPKDIDTTVNYLLSLQYKDGTFISDSDKGMGESEDTTLNRIILGTESVIKSLIALGKADQIPERTKQTIRFEITSALGKNGPFPASDNEDTWKITVAVDLLARVQSSLITQREKDFIIYQINSLVNLPVHTYLIPSRVNRLLDMAYVLDLPITKVLSSLLCKISLD